MNIASLLSTNERIEILHNTIYRITPLKVNSMAKLLGLSSGLVSKYYHILLKEGILKKSGNGFLVQENVRTRALRLLLNLNMLDTPVFKKYDFVKGAGLYGSMARGTNTEHSDFDLWIYHDSTAEENLAALTSRLQKKLGNVRPLYLTDDRIAHLKKEDPLFYHALVFGSIIVYGEGIEAI